MSEMIERVARAIYNADPHLNRNEPIPWEKLRGPIRDAALRYAKAAIEAMREPTYHMERAGGQCLDDVSWGDIKECWLSMIDAALAPPEQPGGA